MLAEERAASCRDEDAVRGVHIESPVGVLADTDDGPGVMGVAASGSQGVTQLCPADPSVVKAEDPHPLRSPPQSARPATDLARITRGYSNRASA